MESQNRCKALVDAVTIRPRTFQETAEWWGRETLSQIFALHFLPDTLKNSRLIAKIAADVKDTATLAASAANDYRRSLS